MTFRLSSYRCGLSLGLLALGIGAASGLHAQDRAPTSGQKNESKPQEVIDESADSKGQLPPPADAASDNGPGGASILDLDIEQLGKVPAKIPTAFDAEVTTVTANKSTIGKSPAAVFVITNEMIRRSGATSIPECFRMVPGMQVAKIGSNKWAISARGFNNGQFANKLLVLVDGRSVYSPFNAGVYWETQDLVLQDVERIEVIRGPGATIWGANAVNGVINIITKTAGDTQGALVSSGGGDQDRTVNSVRYGGQLGENARYRIYARQFDRAAGFNPQGVNDDWNQVRGGFRIDAGDPEQDDTFTLQGDIYGGMIGETATVLPLLTTVSEQNHVGGGSFLGRWTHVVDDDNTWSVQAYYDRTERTDVDFDFAINTYDLEFRQFLKHSGTHTFTWGTGYRVIDDNIQGPLGLSIPQTLTWDQASLFAQEEMPLFRDDLKFIVGSKFLSYYFTGFEYQPSARILWEIDDKQVIWGAVSRAVRTPSRVEEPVNLVGGRTLMSEQLLAYELGYRKQVTDRLSFELATFYNDYDGLITGVSTGVGSPFSLQNAQDARSYGAELNWDWEVHEKWRLRGWYSFMKLQVDGPGNVDLLAGTTPRNQAYLMSSWDLPRKFELDVMSRYVENLPAVGFEVPAYTSLDARLGWRPSKNWGFSIIGQNLLEPHHLEFAGLTTVPSAVNRGVYAQVVWQH